jgi:flagellum-specific ATP synthase
MLGRAVDAFGVPLDGKGAFAPQAQVPLHNEPPNPLERPRIDAPLDVGVRAINGLLTLGKGQRVGIMAGSGVGKSTLMGMVARTTKADVNVIGLVGERGREVVEFMQRDLGPEGMARSVLVVATSDKSPLIRMRAAHAATAIAEWFRDQGKDVLLMMDSVTRFCMAGREVGLAAGEPPTRGGYTPSVFAQLPQLLERAGKSAQGSITGIYTVLVDGDDFTEPIADATRSILDGHIVLTRDLADQGHFPAIDVLKSISRLRSDITPKDALEAGRKVLGQMATFQRVEDMVNIGAYQKGSNPEIDKAIAMRGPINQYLRQVVDEKEPLETSLIKLVELAQGQGPSAKPKK